MKESESIKTLSGVSTLSVSQGDITITAQVEDFTIVAVDRTKTYYDFPYHDKLVKADTTYHVREANLLVDENGYYMTISKDLKKPVLRTARIEVDRWDVSQIVSAQSACGAPETAVVKHVRDSGKTYVEFEWED